MNVPPLQRLAVTFVLEHEGGYVNDPDDLGGETKFGISKRTYPHLDIPSLTREQAIAIYLDDYWHAAGCEQLPPAVAVALFDASVQHGVRKATQMLQRLLGVTADGVVGPITASKAKRADAAQLVHDFLVARADLYHLLANMKSQAKFYRGWISRLFGLQRAIAEVGA